MTLAQNDVLAFDLQGWNGTALETIRVTGEGGAGFTTGAGDTPPGVTYLPRVTHALMLDRTAFGDRTTSGFSVPAAGELDLWNDDFALDYLRTYDFDGRPAVGVRGQSPAVFPSAWTTVLTATMAPAQWDLNGVRFALRDAQRYADVPFQTTLYAGSNVGPSGLEGTPADLKGKPKPQLLGRVPMLAPVCVNRSKLIYQVRDGPVTEIPRLYDGGVPLFVGFPLTSRTSPFTAGGVRGFTFGQVGVGGMFVGVGAGGKLAISTDDGVTWPAQTSSFGSTDILGVAYGTLAGVPRLVAVGAGKIATSNDGVAWTQQLGHAFTGNINAVCFALLAGVETWIAGGDNGELEVSTDGGVTWAAHTSGFAAGQSILHFAVGRTRIIAVGGAITTMPVLSVSTNATAWTVKPTPITGTHIGGVAFGKDGAGAEVYAIIGSNTEQIALSPDGDTYTLLPTVGVLGVNLRSLDYDQELWVAGGAAGLMASSPDARNWTQQSGGFGGTNFFNSVIYRNSVVVAGDTTLVGRIFSSSGAAGTYASLADLQDDSPALVPLAGTYKVYLPGGYLRLGRPPVALVTAGGVAEGATAADRTAAQCWVRTQQRAGLTTGAWSAASIIACDLANSAECGIVVTPDQPATTCGMVAAQFADTLGAAQFAKPNGVLRIAILTEPAVPNLVANPDDLSVSASWIVAPPGSVGTTPAFAISDGIPLTRLTAANTGQVAEVITLTGDGVKRFSVRIQYDGFPGTTQYGLYDTTAPAWLALATVTWAADGTATAAAVFGTVVRLVPRAANAYALVLESTAATASHVHLAYGLAAASMASTRVGRVTVEDTVPGAVLDDDNRPTPEDNGTPLTPLVSADVNDGIPPYRVIVRYGRNYAVQSDSALGTGVADSERAQFTTEWRQAVAENLSILTAHPLSQPLLVDSLYVNESDALTEATRRLALVGRDRQWHEIGFEVTTATAALDLMRVIEVVSHRFGFAAGQRCQVLGMKTEAQSGALTIATFTVWR